MRAVIVVIVTLVVAAGMFLVINFSSEGRPEVPVGGGVDSQKVAALESELTQMQQVVEQLKTQIETLETQTQAAAGRVTPAAAPEAVAETAPAVEKKHIMVPPPEGDIRDIIREEMKKVEEERRKEIEIRNNSWKAEQWEIDEFKELASTIHRAGVVLELTDKQKRLYHPILKDYGERIRSLWKEVQGSNPGAQMGELQKLFKEESDRMLKDTREQVEGILTPDQRKKYKEECKKSIWFK